MLKIAHLLAAAVLLFSIQPAYCEQAANDTHNTAASSSTDQRQLVSMPEQTRQLMRQDMLDHLAALNEVIAYLAEENLQAAADVAETRMGKSSMGKHRATGMGPGRYMPLEMRQIGWGMHESATELSQFAQKGDLKSAYNALQKVTSACVACHHSYRTR